MRRLLAAFGAMLVAVPSALIGAAGPALAGGSPVSPVKDRYEPGDTVTLVGYTGPLPAGWEGQGPYQGYLLSSPATLPADRGVLVGTFSVTATGAQDWSAYRVSLRFSLPDGIPAGRYEVDFCNARCDGGLGDLTGSTPFAVGVDPAAALSIRTWPLTEPEIANLGPDVLVAGPGYQMTALEARSRSLPTLPAPPSVPAAPVAAATSVPSSASAPLDPGSGFATYTPLTRQVDVGRTHRGAHPWALLSGALIALACVWTVLSALRRDGGG